MAGIRLSALADADIADILAYSEAAFGAVARERYARLIAAGIRDLAIQPGRTGVRRRDELGPGICSYHLINSRESARTGSGLVNRPRHLIVFRVVSHEFIYISRLLHDGDPSPTP